MVAGLAGQIAGALTVLKDLNAVAIQAAYDGPRWRRAERSRGDAWLVLERRAERAFKLLRQFLPGEHRRRLERVELASHLGADRRDLLKMQIEVDAKLDRRAAGGGHHHFRAARGVSLRANPHMVGAWRKSFEAETIRRVPRRPRVSASSRTTGAPAIASPLREFTRRPSRTASCANANVADASDQQYEDQYLSWITFSKNLDVRRGGPVWIGRCLDGRCAAGNEHPGGYASAIRCCCVQPLSARTVVMVLEPVERRIERSNGMAEKAVVAFGWRARRVSAHVMGAFVVRDREPDCTRHLPRHAAARKSPRSSWRAGRKQRRPIHDGTSTAA